MVKPKGVLILVKPGMNRPALYKASSERASPQILNYNGRMKSRGRTDMG